MYVCMWVCVQLVVNFNCSVLTDRPMSPLINSLTVWNPNKIRKWKERGSKEKEI